MDAKEELFALTKDHNGSLGFVAKTTFEPYKIKVVEHLPILTREQRVAHMERVHYNVFGLKTEHITLDLLTDSGTSGMSDRQMAGMMVGDESYAGSSSYHKFREAIAEVTGMKHIMPVHQGRAAERLWTQSLDCSADSVIPSNSHCATLKQNIEHTGAEARDFLCKEGHDLSSFEPFKGNMNIEALRKFLIENSENVPAIMVCITNNINGGQPVSMANLRDVRKLADQYDIQVVCDAARFAENAYFIQQREDGYQSKSIRSISKEMFSNFDGILMSMKKDGFGASGGFLAHQDDDIFQKAQNLAFFTEGFETYGGLAGRDLESLAIGMDEVLDQNYLKHRIESIRNFHDTLDNAGVPVVHPVGGHAIYIDCNKFFSKGMPATHLRAMSLSIALYLEAGVRSGEMGTMSHCKQKNGCLVPADMELLRLCIPRRVYTSSHFDYVAEALIHLYENRERIPGLKVTHIPKVLPFYTARFEPLDIHNQQ